MRSSTAENLRLGYLQECLKKKEWRCEYTNRKEREGGGGGDEAAKYICDTILCFQSSLIIFNESNLGP